MDDEKKTVHRQLREEIMYNINKQDFYTTAAYTVAISLWTIALDKSNEWIALVALIILFPISLRVSDCRYSTAFLASYVSVFIEQKSPYGWEYVRELYYSRFKRMYSSRLIYLCSKYGFWLLSAISSVMFWAIRDFNFEVRESKLIGYGILVFQFVIIAVQILICNKYTNISNIKKPLLNNWQTLYAEMNNKVLDTDSSRTDKSSTETSEDAT